MISVDLPDRFICDNCTNEITSEFRGGRRFDINGYQVCENCLVAALIDKADTVELISLSWRFGEVSHRNLVPRTRSPEELVRQSFTASTRKAALERDKYRCLGCGSHKDLEVDHIVPISRGGDNSLKNLQTLCANCHKIKTANDRRSE